MKCNYGKFAWWVSLMVVLGLYGAAWAFQGSTQQGDLMYEVYDTAVNRILQGPVGFVSGMLAILFGALLAVRSEIWLAIVAILSGIVVLKADAITTALGLLV